MRYPGGKSCLLELTVELIRLNRLEQGHYAEPYAGGAGLALSLLFGGHVTDIHINDVDPAIWSFWHSVLNNGKEFRELVSNTPVTIEEWRKQREINRAADMSNTLTLGFSTFFLNRTNRSGVVKSGGVIGGLEQDGPYKIDCRFNREDLARRLKRIESYSDRIHLTGLDARKFLSRCQKTLPEKSLLFADPPYFHKGAALYTSFYKAQDHEKVASSITGLELPWVVTYDDIPEIRSIYRGYRQYSFDISYSVQEKRVGTELFIASKGMKVPESLRQRLVQKPQYRAAA